MTGLLAVTGVIVVLFASAYAGLTDSDNNSALDSPGVQITPVTDADVEADDEDNDSVNPEATATPVAPPPEPTQPPAAPTQAENRGDCNQIRGTDYLSPEERTWFLANCVNN